MGRRPRCRVEVFGVDLAAELIAVARMRVPAAVMSRGYWQRFAEVNHGAVRVVEQASIFAKPPEYDATG